MTREDIERWYNNESSDHVMQTIDEITKLLPFENFRIIDVGSNCGTFCEMLSKHIPIERAVLIEPSQELIEFSKDILPTHFEYIQSAIVDNESIKEVCMVFPENQQLLNLGIARIDVYGDTIVPARTLSNVLQNIDFIPNYIKIDAEGYDTKILLSIADDIRVMSEKPFITFEVDKSRQQDDLKRIEYIFINELGYDIIDFRDGAISTDMHLMPPE